MKNFAIVLVTLLVSSNVFAWSLKTHKYIVEKGFSIFENDYYSIVNSEVIDPNYQILSMYKDIIIENSLTPDSIAFGIVVNKDGYDLSAKHTHCIEEGNEFSAEKQVQRFISRALSEWASGNYNDAAKFLGYAFHFYGDLNNSYHAANVKFYDPPITGHGDYELYVNRNLGKYSVPTSVANDPSLVSKIYTDSLQNFNDIDAFLYDLTWADVVVARNYFYSDANKFHQYKHYDIAAENTLPRAEKGVALIIYRFLEELNLATKLTINVSTFNEKGAGTSEDNYVKLKLHFKDGVDRNIVLGHLNSDDFSRGSIGSYAFLLYGKNYDLSHLDGITLQKEGRDDWKVGTIQLLVNGELKLTRTLNRWIKKALEVN